VRVETESMKLSSHNLFNFQAYTNSIDQLLTCRPRRMTGLIDHRLKVHGHKGAVRERQEFDTDWIWE
jgi:hypothetical protein